LWNWVWTQGFMLAKQVRPESHLQSTILLLKHNPVKILPKLNITILRTSQNSSLWITVLKSCWFSEWSRWWLYTFFLIGPQYLVLLC
jgi:hypothetical protein